MKNFELENQKINLENDEYSLFAFIFDELQKFGKIEVYCYFDLDSDMCTDYRNFQDTQIKEIFNFCMNFEKIEGRNEKNFLSINNKYINFI